MTVSFASARSKVKRANKHIDEVVRLVAAFVENPHTVRFYNDQFTGAYVRETTINTPDADISFAIGDTVHNLKTALDHIWCEITVEHDGEIESWTRFPFKDSRKELVNGLAKNAAIQRAPADLITFIQDDLKPYVGGDGDAFFYALHKLDILDKHHGLAGIVGVARVQSPPGPGHYGIVGEGAAEGIRMEPDTVLRVLSRLPFEDQKNSKPPAEVLFRDFDPYSGRPVVETLHQLSQLVSRIVETFAKAYGV